MRLSRIILTFAGFFFALTTNLFAAGISISPLKYELNIEPGKEASQLIKVTNSTDGALTLYTSKEDFVAGDDTGTPSFVKKQNATSDEYSLSSWITVEESNFTLAKGETREIRFRVKAPSNAEPGGHYGAVFFSPGSPEKGQVTVVQRLGVLLLVNVPGEVKIAGGLDSFNVGSSDQNKFTGKSEFDAFPIVFQTRFKNDGNTHLKPTGKIELVDDNGNVLKSIGKETITTPTGVFVGEKMVDYIPVNDGLGSVLPKSERRFDSTWEGFGYQVINEDGTKSVKFKNLTEYYADTAAEKQQYLKFYESVHTREVTKKFQARLTLAYEGKDKERKEFKENKDVFVTYEEQYVGINYGMIVLVLILLGGFGWYVAVYLPKSRERLRESILSEMGKASGKRSKKEDTSI